MLMSTERCAPLGSAVRRYDRGVEYLLHRVPPIAVYPALPLSEYIPFSVYTLAYPDTTLLVEGHHAKPRLALVVSNSINLASQNVR
jgi:hypothetical protein